MRNTGVFLIFSSFCDSYRLLIKDSLQTTLLFSWKRTTSTANINSFQRECEEGKGRQYKITPKNNVFLTLGGEEGRDGRAAAMEKDDESRSGERGGEGHTFLPLRMNQPLDY